MEVKTPPPPSPADKEQIVLEIRKAAQQISEMIRDLSSRTAVLQKDVIGMRDTLNAMSQDLAAARVQRLEQEIVEQEKERMILEERLKAVDEKLEAKKVATAGAINTTDRIRQAAELTYEERERLEKEQRAAAWAKRKDAIVTAVLVSLSVGFVGSVVTAVWWFVTFYLNNR